MRLLMIDDDETLADTISQHLIQQHYAVDIATNGHMGLEFVDLFDYDLIILDLMLPDLDGQTLCTRIRQNQHLMPILMLTSRDKAEDKIQGLDAGADDYIVKPIHLPELLARIRALLRRSSSITPTQLEWGLLTLDPNSFEATYDDQLIAFTPKEYSILELFLRNPLKSHTLDGIIDNIWQLDDPPSLYAIRTHIKSIRHKLKDLGAPTDFIETLYGFGYRLNPTYHQVLTESEPHQPAEPIADQIETTTQVLWSKHKSDIDARIQTLETLGQAIKNHSVTDELKQQGIQIAHKLAGSLGCFSFLQGSKLAKKLELQLSNSVDSPDDILCLVQQLRESISPAPTQSAKTSKSGDRRHLLAYSHQKTLFHLLEAEIPNYGFTLTSVFDVNTLVKQIQMHRPDVILLDIDQVKNSLNILALLKDNAPNVPVLVILNNSQWQERLDYIHQGVRRVFQTPASVSSILEAAHHLDCSQHHSKLLLVDDDHLLLSAMNDHLSALGFQVTTLEKPTKFWSTLQQVQPDLVILDFEMPEISGLELCQLLRADPDWTDTPVIFLTNHQEEQTEDQAFRVGADDFISKDCPLQRLALRINNRLR